MLKTKAQFKEPESWNDGIINVLEASDGVITSNRAENIRFGKKVVGVKRFYEAKVAGDEIEGMISIPYGVDVRQTDVIELKNYDRSSSLKDGLYYISQIQEAYTAPKSLHISLKKGMVELDDNRPKSSI